jgi:transposase
MRGNSSEQNDLYSYISLEDRVPATHPLRALRELIDAVLKSMSRKFDKLYSKTGRPSIPPEMLVKTLFLQVLYGIRSERLVLEQLDFNLLYRWFVGMTINQDVWNETVFTKNRDRLFAGEALNTFFAKVLEEADKRGLLSHEHFSVDGTLIESWASLKSFQKKDNMSQNDDDGDPGNPSVNFHGETRRNETHQSTTDTEARLYRKGKGKEARLYYMGHVVMENRNGLAVGLTASSAGYHEERKSALRILKEIKRRKHITLGGDKGYDREDFVTALQAAGVTPHIAQNIHSRKHHSAIDERTTRHPGYHISQCKRKLVEEIFGWAKGASLLRRPHFRGLKRIGAFFKFVISVYNLLRIRNLCYA